MADLTEDQKQNAQNVVSQVAGQQRDPVEVQRAWEQFTETTIPVDSSDIEHVRQERLQGMQRAGEWSPLAEDGVYTIGIEPPVTTNQEDLQGMQKADSEWSMTDGAREDSEEYEWSMTDGVREVPEESDGFGGTSLDDYLKQQEEQAISNDAGVSLEEYIRQQNSQAQKVDMGITTEKIIWENAWDGVDGYLQDQGYNQDLEQSVAFKEYASKSTINRMQMAGIENIAVGEKEGVVQIVYQTDQGPVVQKFNSAGMTEEQKAQLAVDCMEHFIVECSIQRIQEAQAQIQPQPAPTEDVDLSPEAISKNFYDGLARAQEELCKKYGPGITLEAEGTGAMSKSLNTPQIRPNELQQIYMVRDGVRIPVARILPSPSINTAMTSDEISSSIVSQTDEMMKIIKQ